MMMLSEIDMEGTGMEELMVGSCNKDATHIAKGKRTKRRLRPLSPCTTAMTSSCSSASGGGASFSSATFEDQEEEDMANCLILLAQGKGGDSSHDDHKHNHHGGHVKKESSNIKIDLYVYECKTCNRTFPSFQALGGHRASHKKPKVMITQQEENKWLPLPPPPPPPPPSQLIGDFEESKENHVKMSLQLGCGNNMRGNKSKIHECSICGSEFTSGQALGGHMRRHRASNTNTTTTTTLHNTTFDKVKPPNVLEFDLNLPAPEDDLRDSNFQFPTNQNSIVLSAAPPLVGCHY
ncbi:hypothetical protein VNO77_28835 [Canavalia gladiata]|uniref:C2H2-type domain-containing protein n=1 Tax=Canavalia gladiata TaxID=3824 RepID=A0AAN9QBD6_CANGL